MSETMIAVSNTPKRVLMSSSSRNKIEETERELQELLAAQQADTPEVEQPVETENNEASVVEQKTKEPETGWEKRYKDLQRFMARKDDEIKKLKEQVDKPVEGPGKVTKERVQEWVKKYPDVADIVKSLAKEIATEQYGQMSEALEELDSIKVERTIAKTEAAILKEHPDYMDLKEDPDFHSWLEDMPKAVQSVVYDTIDDPKGVSRIIKMYKAESDKGETSKEAASSLGRRRSSPEVSNGSRKFTFTESQIDRMSPAEYQKNYEAIMEARNKGQIKFDISGGSR